MTMASIVSLRKGVAVKSTNSRDFRKSHEHLLNEWNTLSRLDHKNIVELVGFSLPVEDSLGFVLILQLLQKKTLCDRLEQWREEKTSATDASDRDETKQLYDRVATTGPGIASGMQYLHSKGIVLRDLKPENIGYDRKDDAVRIFDFGMAETVEGFETNRDRGTQLYKAPEVGASRSNPGSKFGDPRAVDVYSFGIVLGQISSLEPPGPPEKFLEKGVACPDVRGLVVECLRKDPSTRPSFEEITQRLTEIVSSSTVSPQRSKKRARKNDP